jgi:CheY-like chemotaxis protein
VSLNGSIEDLPLLEILQVVSFCQKTGHLSVRGPKGEAGVVFEAGRVVAGHMWDVPPLPAQAPPPGPARELVVRQRIATILERLVRLREGDFAFHLSESVPTVLGDRDLSGETLPFGINPEELMLDLARQLDEDRREAAAVIQASFAAPPPPPEAAAEEAEEAEELEEIAEVEDPGPAGPAVLLVDDEPEVRRVVGDRLRAAGVEVALAGGAAEARRQMGRLSRERGRFLVVTDLGLPSASSFRGGLDVARHASGLSPAPPVLLMAEAIDEKLRGRARRLGVSLLAFKPGLSKLDPLQYESDLRAFGDKLACDLLPRLARGPRRTPSALSPEQAGREEVLRSALEEMRRGADPDLVSFLLLRTARAFFPRVVLFLVQDDSLRGLAGFGPVDSEDSLDLLARRIALPLAPASPLSEAVSSGRAWAGPLPPDGPARGLLDRIGALGARAAAVLPVRAGGHTVAIVYGDAPGGAELPPLEPLVAFVEEAGRALDEALLGRRAGAA